MNEKQTCSLSSQPKMIITENLTGLTCCSCITQRSRPPIFLLLDSHFKSSDTFLSILFLSCFCDFSCRQVNLCSSFLACPLLCKHFLSEPPGLSSDWLERATQSRSFTLCQEKARLEDWGQAGCAAPHQPRWGESGPFGREPALFVPSWPLRLKNFVDSIRKLCNSHFHLL